MCKVSNNLDSDKNLVDALKDYYYFFFFSKILR